MRAGYESDDGNPGLLEENPAREEPDTPAPLQEPPPGETPPPERQARRP